MLIIEKLEELEQNPEALDVGEDAFDDSYDDPYDPHGVHRRGRRVLTSISTGATVRDNGGSCH